MPTTVQSSNLNEELGMVHYIFSDKTGTLTQNIMEFKKFVAGKESYGSSTPGADCNLNGITNVNFEDAKFAEDRKHANASYINKFIEILGVCHTIIVEERHGKIHYNAASPDELALVNAAKFFGFEFKGRDEDNHMLIRNSFANTESKYKLLNVIEFTSARKRMTVVVRDPHGQIKVYIKGADSILMPLLRKEEPNLKQTLDYLDGYAKEGLRTLLVAEKVITE